MPLNKPTKEELRRILQERLDSIIEQVNAALLGKSLEALESVLARVGRGSKLPHWYSQLKSSHSLPNLDGKTVGSVVEMILVAVLETFIFEGLAIPPLRVNPARGVDLPDLDLSVKSPSKNFCTSEPFFSPYERLYGNEYDAVVLLTDYQEAKKKPPLKLQITQWRYLKGAQIADKDLCRIALKHRNWLIKENEAWAKRVFKFLAYANRSDWRAKNILKLTDQLRDEDMIRKLLSEAGKDFKKQNKKRESKDQDPIPESDLMALNRILDIQPNYVGIIDAAENWVLEVLKDAARAPNENEWKQLLESSLDGRIGMSFAWQWRYAFGRLFNGIEDVGECEDENEEL